VRGEEVVGIIEDRDLTPRYTEEAIDFIRRNKDNPFFLYLAHGMPHTPLDVTDEFKGKSERGLYGDVVLCLDWSTGEIARTLKELGIEGKTLVIFTSDNGPAVKKGELGGKSFPFKGGKPRSDEGGFRVPCVVWWPGKIPAGSTCSEMTTMMDILPTFANLIGAELPQDRVIDGKNIWPLMSGAEDAKSPYDAFYYYVSDRLLAVRSGEWKLVYERRPLAKQPDQPSNAVMSELYHLKTDPGERRNMRARKPRIAGRLDQLANEMRRDLGDANAGWPAVNARPAARVE
jgi:arylsulfatase A-like enzyme